MKKIRQFIALVLSISMLFSTEGFSLYAAENESSAVVAGEATTETTEMTETVEDTEEVGATETTEMPGDTEVVEETEQNINLENAEGVGEVVPSDEIEECEKISENVVATEAPEVVEEILTEIPEIIEYDDVLEFEVIKISPEEIEGEVYDAEELIEMAENMPALMSESYGYYWDNYTSYYIYNRLSEDAKKLWRGMEILYSEYLTNETDLTNGLTDFITVATTTPISEAELLGLANMFKYSHPQYYYLMSGYSYYATDTYVGLAFAVYDKFIVGTDRTNATVAMKTQLGTWYEEIASYSTEEEKVKAIHDIICDKVDYNHGVLEGDNAITNEEEAIYFTQSAYSVFCKDLTVCAGYTQAFMWLCNAFDIECFGVTSPGHAWNKVKVNDNWYNMDVTWDDRVGVGERYYAHYIRNDAYMDSIGGHAEDEEWLAYLPDCTLDSGSDYDVVGSAKIVTDRVATPVINVTESDEGYIVEISTAAEGADIIYTLDGNAPSESNTKGYLYTGAFSINETAVIRAIAVCDGYLDSAIAEGGSIEEKVYTVASGKVGTDINWQLDSTGLLCLTGSGEMNSYTSAAGQPWASYADYITTIEVGGNITSVGNYAFAEIPYVYEVVLPSTVTTIGAYAFYGNGVEEIVIPDSVTNIGDYAFYDTCLGEITLPASVTSLGSYAFAYNYYLEAVEICGNVTSVGRNAFSNCYYLETVELSDSFTIVGDYMFMDCGSLTEIILPESLTSIGFQGFSYCDRLEEVSIPGKVTLGYYAFYDNAGLKKVTIMDGMTKIPYGTFAKCTALQEIRIPKSVTFIESGAIETTATIYGFAGSTAETYAKTNGNPFVGVDCKVRFVTGLNGRIIEAVYEKNVLIEEPVIGEKVGYTFAGWYTSEEVWDETTRWNFEEDVITEAMTLYAKWEANTYHLSFNGNYEGAEEIEGKNIVFEGAYGELPSPARTGYSFAGWYSKVTDGERITADSIYKTPADTTIYAYWTPNTYVVTFEPNGGVSSVETLSVTYDATYGELPVPTKEGYYFLGWYTDATDGVEISADTVVKIEETQTLYARWLEMVYPAQTTVLAVAKADGTVEVSWEEVEICTKYYVYRGLANSNTYAVVKEATKGVTSYTDTSTKVGTKYRYYVVCEYADVSGYVTQSQSEVVGTRQEIQEDWLLYSESQEYTGTDFAPTVIVKNGSTILAEGVDYLLTCVPESVDDENIYRVTIEGIGEYISSQYVFISEQSAIIQNSMVGEIPEMIFNGGALEPNPEVSYNGATLVKDVDYTLTYANNTDIGTATVTITGIGHFEGQVTRHFLIRTKTMEQSFVAAIANQEYTGEAIEPDVVLTHNGNMLKENVDYRISFSNNTEVGQATATIKGRGNYVGTIKVQFQIVGADLAGLESRDELTVLVEGSDVAYSTLHTGKAIEPEVKLVLASGKELASGKDYVVTYADNVTPGTATITISGKGNYAGKITKTFDIRKHDIGEAYVTAGRNLTVLYSPVGQMPVPRVEYNGTRLTKDVDFAVAYYQLDASGMRVGTEVPKVTGAGKYEVILKGIGTFTGTLEHVATITVKARALDGGNVVVENPYARIDGDVVTAHYQILFAGQPLVEGTDYTKTIHISASGNEATYVFTGKGNYSGTLTQKFRLVAADIIIFSEGKYEIEPIEDQSYTGERVCPTVRVVKADDANEQLVEGRDYTVSYKYNLKVGTATVIVTGAGDCVGTMKGTFEIVPSTSVNVVFENEFVYNAAVQQPEIFATADAGTLTESVDYTVTYLDESGNPVESKDAGSYKAVVTFKGNYAGEKICEYTILPCPVGALQVEIPDKKYTGSEILPTLNEMTILLDGRKLTAEEKAGLVIASGLDNVEVSDQAIVVLNGSDNFDGEARAFFRIVEKPISDADLDIWLGGEEISSNVTGYKAEWTGNAIEPSVEIKNGAKTLVESEDYTLTYRYNTEIGTARVIIYGLGDYQSSRTLYFVIEGLTFSEEKGYEVTVAEGDYVYNGTKHQPVVNVTKDGISLTRGEDFNVSYSDNVNAGTAKVTVTGMGRYTGTIFKTFTIAPKTAEDALTIKTSGIARQRYTGERIMPEITVEIDGVKLVKGEDFTTTVLNGVDAGIATLVVTGIGNYGGVLAEKQFEIYYTTITYVMNGGVNAASNPSYYTATDSFVLADPEPRDAYNFAGWYSNAACTNRVKNVKAGTNGNLTFYAKWTPKQVYGLDVSKWQNQADANGAINWNSVKNAGKTFAMIRLSYGTTLDPYFEYNYSGARNAGLKVGVYCYNTATTVDAAVRQAHDVLAKLGGRPLDYPVCLDMEGDTVGALDNVTRTNIVFAFKNVVEAAGYDFILYANKNWLDNYFVDERLAPLDLWIARYCDFNLGHRYTGPGKVRMWQYTSSGTVSGIKGLVDLNICYEDYVKK